MSLSTLAKDVRQYLRDLFEDDPQCAIQSTEEIADMFNMSATQMYDHDYDTGPLFELMQEGYVDRYGDRNEGWSWRASGCEIEYNWR